MLVLILLPIPAKAQEPRIRFEHISLEQGLSHDTVFSMVQDQTGFIWFGTQSGLNKYDGYNITVFRHDPHDPNSVSNDNAGNLFIDRQGIIWIGTWGGGVDRLNPETGEFSNYTHNPADPGSLSADRVQTIFEDSAGGLWVGTSGGGVNRFDPQTESFSHYRHNPNRRDSLSHDRVWRIVEDHTRGLWVATSDGLNKFDPRTETFTRYYHDPTDPASLGDNLVRTLYVDRSGTLWVGTETGLDRFDSQTETFTHYRHAPDDPYSISDDIINAILEDSAGNFWVGTSRGGLNKFDRQTETFSPYLADPRRPDSLSHNDVRWILEDRSGVIWVATRGGGVNKFSPAIEKFRYLSQDPFNSNSLNNNDVRAIYEDEARNLWIGTKGGGLDNYDAGTGRFSYYLNDPDDPNSLGHNDVYVIHQDRSGIFWLGLAGGGLNRFDPQTETFTRYENDPADPASLSNDDINSIYEDRSGLLWIGTKGGGLNRFDPQTETFVRYQNDPADPNSLGNDDVYEIYQEPSGHLWVSTYGGGLNLFDPETGKFTRYQYDPANPTSLSNNDIYAIHQDRNGTLWIGTANGGLNKLLPLSLSMAATETNDNNPQTGQFTHYTVADGLISQVVYAILEDEQGNLWLSTSKGLARFDPRTETFVSYDASDGLESVGYHEGAYFKSKSGEMFFGGINGLIRFYPAEIKENPFPPPVVLTSLSLPRHNMLLSKPLRQLSEVELSYEDDVFTFEFAALDYTNPAKNQFAYKLEGFDQDWISAGNRRFATYTNLDPGSYTFWVKASNNAGVWNETGTSINVVVTPPLWETWWFRTLALIAIVGLAFTGYYVRISSIQAQQERLQILVDERTAELSEANENMRTLNERMQLELKMAQEIERSLLPPPRPDWSGLDLLCYSASAREVGGDFYAYHLFAPAEHSANGNRFPRAVQIPEKKFAIAVGDASGKGMPAALLMAVSLASFQSALDEAMPPAELLAYLDEAIMPYTRTGNQNCSFCYLEISSFLNKKEWQMRVANAGCIPPFIRRKDGTVEWIDIGGTPLGIGLGAEDGYQETSLTLEPGELVILTSDGVVEAMTAGHEMFGFERLQQAVASGPTTNAEAMVIHLRQVVEVFTDGAEPHDDLTIVVIQI